MTVKRRDFLKLTSFGAISPFVPSLVTNGQPQRKVREREHLTNRQWRYEAYRKILRDYPEIKDVFEKFKDEVRPYKIEIQWDGMPPLSAIDLAGMQSIIEIIAGGCIRDGLVMNEGFHHMLLYGDAFITMPISHFGLNYGIMLPKYIYKIVTANGRLLEYQWAACGPQLQLLGQPFEGRTRAIGPADYEHWCFRYKPEEISHMKLWPHLLADGFTAKGHEPYGVSFVEFLMRVKYTDQKYRWRFVELARSASTDAEVARLTERLQLPFKSLLLTALQQHLSSLYGEVKALEMTEHLELKFHNSWSWN